MFYCFPGPGWEVFVIGVRDYGRDGSGREAAASTPTPSRRFSGCCPLLKGDSVDGQSASNPTKFMEFGEQGPSRRSPVEGPDRTGARKESHTRRRTRGQKSYPNFGFMFGSSLRGPLWQPLGALCGRTSGRNLNPLRGFSQDLLNLRSPSN